MPKTTHHQKTKSNSSNIAYILSAFILGIIVTFLFLLFCAWLFTITQLPSWSAIPFATASVCIGAFISSCILAQKLNKNGLFCGLCFGICYFILYLLAALLNGQFDYTAFSCIKFVCYTLSGCIGGFCGILINEQNTRKRHFH